MEKKSFSRRGFFKFAVSGLLAIPFIAKAAQKASCPKSAPAGKQIATPADGLGYVAVATSVKNPKFKAGSNCGNCKLFKKDKLEGGYAPCPMLSMKYVSSCGWCTAYIVAAK